MQCSLIAFLFQLIIIYQIIEPLLLLERMIHFQFAVDFVVIGAISRCSYTRKIYRLLFKIVIIFLIPISGSDELCFLCESLNITHTTYRDICGKILANIWGIKNAEASLKEQIFPPSLEEKLPSESIYEKLL